MTPDALKAQIEQALRGMFEVWYPNDSLRVMVATTAAMNVIAPHLTPEAQGAQPPQESLSIQRRKHFQAGGHIDDFVPKPPRPAGPHAGLAGDVLRRAYDAYHSALCDPLFESERTGRLPIAEWVEARHNFAADKMRAVLATALQRAPEPWTRQQVELAVLKLQRFGHHTFNNFPTHIKMLERYALHCPSAEPETR